MAILDQYGNSISSRAFLKSAENGGGRMPSTVVRAMEPLKKLITQRDWQTVSYISDKFFANFPLAEAIICQKAMHAVGSAWRPVFKGEATDWGQEARRWLIEEWYPSCDVRGLNYDFVTDLYQGSLAIDAAGDLIELFSISENGWPMIQMIPSRQIGQWEHGDKVKGGKYDGAIIRNGIIKDRAGRPIAYRKLGDERGEFEDIEARNVLHTFEPKWIDQDRGFPIFTSCLEDIGMSNQSEEWEQQSMLIASAIGLIETNESGSGEDPDDPATLLRATAATESTPAGVQIQSMLGGMVRYMKANTGSKLEQFVSAKPGAEWGEYQDRIARKIATAANWSYGYAWKPETITGTAQRAELGKCRMAVSDRQSLIDPRAKRKIGYAISVAMRPVSEGGLGALPPYPGKDKGGFLKWGFTKPQRISIDEGRDRAQRRADNQAGLILDSTIVEEDGDTTYDDFLWNRAREAAKRETIRLAVEKEMNVSIDPREMKMFTPNDQAVPEPQEPNQP
jgi:hypothetical protein